jgi:hypothetical protein
MDNPGRQAAATFHILAVHHNRVPLYDAVLPYAPSNELRLKIVLVANAGMRQR